MAKINARGIQPGMSLWIGGQVYVVKTRRYDTAWIGGPNLKSARVIEIGFIGGEIAKTHPDIEFELIED